MVKESYPTIVLPTLTWSRRNPGSVGGPISAQLSNPALRGVTLEMVLGTHQMWSCSLAANILRRAQSTFSVTRTVLTCLNNLNTAKLRS